MNRLILTNGKVIFPDSIEEQMTVVVKDSVIQAIMPSDEVKIEEGDMVVDAGGKYISPGFVDIHTHGGGGAWHE